MTINKMTINKHGSFYMRSGWGTKILQAIENDQYIFSPSKEQSAVDEIGLGRVMVKALRYWSTVLGLTIEEKDRIGIRHNQTHVYELVRDNDLYFQKKGSLLLLHRNLALNSDNATAWYWFFNEWESATIDKTDFVEGLQTFLAVNEMRIQKETLEKEYNCLKNTYIGEKKFDRKSIMDEDTYPFFAPLKILKFDENKRIVKRQLDKKDIPIEILIYCIVKDNEEAFNDLGQVSIETLVEEKKQVGKYFNIKYSKLIEALLEAENKQYIRVNNNFGNRYIEFLKIDYESLLQKYYNDRN